MSIFRRALAQGSLYTLFQGIGMLVSLVSFPVLTRVLSVTEYGYLALYNATAAIFMAVAKCGLTTSFIRGYAATSFTDNSRTRLYSSAVATGFLLGLTVTLAYLLSVYLLSDKFESNLSKVLILAGISIFVGALMDLFFAFLRAEERVLLLSVLSVISRIGAVVTGVSLLLFFAAGLPGYLIGSISFQCAVIIGIGYWFFRRKFFHFQDVSCSTSRQLLSFGAPLLLFEMSSMINDYADRFLIQYFLGSGEVGVYSVGYNLATYIQGFVTAPLWMTIFPIYTKLWEKEGPKKTSEFLERFLEYYLILAILLVVIITVASKEIIVLLASEKYSAAADISPLIIVSIMLYGTTHITGAGIFLAKRTGVIAALTVVCAGINVAMNLVLLPRYGILGAAYATVVSYLVLTVLITWLSRSSLQIKWSYRSLAICLFAGFVASYAAMAVSSNSLLVALLSKTIAATTSYLAIVLALNGGLRATFLSQGKAVLTWLHRH